MEACQDDPGQEERLLWVFVFHLLPSHLDDCCSEVAAVEDIQDDRWMEEDNLVFSSVPEQPRLDQEWIC